MRSTTDGRRQTNLVEGKDEESSAARRFRDDGDVLWIDGAERRIPGTLRDADVVVTLVALERLSEHVTELALPDDAEGHLERCTRRRYRPLESDLLSNRSG